MESRALPKKSESEDGAPVRLLQTGREFRTARNLLNLKGQGHLALVIIYNNIRDIIFRFHGSLGIILAVLYSKVSIFAFRLNHPAIYLRSYL